MKYSYVNANGFLIPARVRTVKPKSLNKGFTVSDMLNASGVTWAHRGGSANFPDMSEYAYDESSSIGYQVLEFSAQRTSDGWWFGLHDNTLTRTSPGAPNTSIRQLTRAQVESYTNQEQPYYGMVDFIQKFSEKNVLVLDPKNSIDLSNEFLDIIDQYAGPENIVIKYFGTGSGGATLSDRARARGYQTWGFWYEDDYLSGAMATWQSRYTLLGMDVDAPTAWTGPNNVLSYGKPVVAHILQSKVKYDKAVALGASMMQCANVVDIPAVPTKQ